MKDSQYTELLKAINKVDKRVAVVEARTEDLREIRKTLEGLRVKVAGVAATVAIVVTFVTLFVAKLAQ